MRVLYWTERYWPHIGGVEVLSLQLLPALAARGFSAHIVTSHSDHPLPDEDECEGVPLSRMHFLTSLTHSDLSGLVAARRRLAALKEKFRPDLVHIHFSGPSPYFHWQTRDAFPAPTLVTIHSLPKAMQRSDSLLAQTLREANWVNTVSAAKLGDIRALVPEVRQRSSVVYNGLALPATQPAPLPQATPIILCLGRLVGWKGFDLALDAFAILAGSNSGARMIIAGDGPARTELEQQAAALGVGNRVDITGWVEPDRIPELINRATLVLLPSRVEETLPVVALQAAQMARPMIAADIAGLPELVRHEQTGLLVAPDEAAALAGAIERLLANPAYAHTLGLAARRMAETELGLDRWADSYAALYHKLIGDFRGGKARDLPA